MELQKSERALARVRILGNKIMPSLALQGWSPGTLARCFRFRKQDVGIERFFCLGIGTQNPPSSQLRACFQYRALSPQLPLTPLCHGRGPGHQ